MASYARVKVAVIDVVDDFTKKDVAANYKPLGSGAYSAKTKLASLSINETVLATMTIRFCDMSTSVPEVHVHVNEVLA